MKQMYMSFFVLVLFNLFSCGQGNEKEIYIIPSGFKGKVNVIFNRSNGEPAKYQDGVRVYEIPQDGILLTQFQVQEGLIKREYYYSDKTPLKIVVNQDDANGSEVSIFRDGTIGVYGDSKDKNSLTYQEFYVTDKNNLESYFTDESVSEFDKRVQTKTGYKF